MKNLAISLGALCLLITVILLLSFRENANLKRELTLERGDEVEIIYMSESERENRLFEGCSAHYITGVATSVGNVVLLTLRDCAHPFFKDKPVYPELRNRETIRKKLNI
jgi:hypothetical protein